jgi:hypothetical protein
MGCRHGSGRMHLACLHFRTVLYVPLKLLLHPDPGTVRLQRYYPWRAASSERLSSGDNWIEAMGEAVSWSNLAGPRKCPSRGADPEPI